MYHHTLDPYPIPKDKSPLYVNELWLIDKTLPDYHINSEQDNNDDNVRIYVPLDLNHDAILRRLDWLIVHYEEANEANEFEFANDVGRITAQIEIYDQIWSVRHMPEKGEHSIEAIALVEEVTRRQEDISDGCA